VRGLERDLTVLAEACGHLGDHEVVPHLLDVAEAALAALSASWPTATGTTLARLPPRNGGIPGNIWGLPPELHREAIDIALLTVGLWSGPPVPSQLEPLPEAARRAARRAREQIQSRLVEIREAYPPVGRLALAGHAHLDLAWLWPVAETRRKGRRTFATVLGLMDRYPDFTFVQSSAQLYAWIEEDNPELFERVRRRVAEGRWEPVGGSWVEPDCQMAGGEAFVRQLLYGQRYFEQRFGRRCSVAWLPDTFGFSGALPQLLRGAGITGFLTTKLTWNETNAFPYDLFQWEGIDGSRVKAHIFRNPAHGYNGDIAPRDLLGTWRGFEGKRRHGESLFTFGRGDGGGGPSEQMLENYARLKDFPALPRLRMVRVEEFFRSLPEEGLPVRVGELYLERHRGTLTSQGKVKALNRAAEHRLSEAEACSALAALLGAGEGQVSLDDAWKTLLLNQFHDVLPGSSIREVYEEAHRQLAAVIEVATERRDAALRALAARLHAPGEGPVALVANPSLVPRPLTALLPETAEHDITLLDMRGEPLPAQRTADGLLVHAPERRVPGLGWTSLLVSHTRPPAPRQPVAAVRIERVGEEIVLENDLLRVAIGRDGTFARVFDRELAREVLAGRGNQLWAYIDKPRAWNAWDIDEGYEREGQEIREVEAIRIVETGPLRAAARVARRWRDSRIVQTYRLLAGSRRLEIVTEIDWHERQVLLRALFPVAVRAPYATYETMYGALTRPTHANTSWERARFEVSAHRFVDLSEPGYGVALLNHGKYGHSARGNVLGLSLLRSPVYPDPQADEGTHRFTYALFPHPGDWTSARVVDEALALNSPLCAVLARPAGGELPPEFGLVEVDGLPVRLGCFKRAEAGSGWVLRLYEPHGARGMATLRFGRPVQRVERVNLLEEPETTTPAPELAGEAVRLAVRPFEVVSLRLELWRAA
jgi:alpha-mannosidase